MTCKLLNTWTHVEHLRSPKTCVFMCINMCAHFLMICFRIYQLSQLSIPQHVWRFDVSTIKLSQLFSSSAKKHIARAKIHPLRTSPRSQCKFLPCNCLSRVVLRCVCRRLRLKKIWKKGVLVQCLVGVRIPGGKPWIMLFGFFVYLFFSMFLVLFLIRVCDVYWFLCLGLYVFLLSMGFDVLLCDVMCA